MNPCEDAGLKTPSRQMQQAGRMMLKGSLRAALPKPTVGDTQAQPSKQTLQNQQEESQQQVSGRLE